MKAFVINLDDRPDRLELFRKQSFPFPVERISGVEDSVAEDGCTAAHLSILEKQTEFPFIVFEDDCMLIEPWSVVEEAIKQLPENWDALWLGALVKQPLTKYSENLFKLTNAFALHAVIYNSKRMVDYILEYHGTPSGTNLDYFYRHMVLKNFNCYITYPMVATQRSDVSNIGGKFTNHTKELLYKYDRFTIPSFNQMIRKSYAHNGVKQKRGRDWKIVRALYEKNYIQFTDLTEKIPKKIHQIWLGSPFPDKYKKWADSWKKFNPDWEYKLWTEENIHEIKIPYIGILNRLKNVAQKSDYLRYHILNQFGGIYVDTDFECLKSFDSLLYLDFFTGIGYPEDVELYIGLIASVPEHPLIEHICRGLKDIEPGSHWLKIFNSTGSYFFTRKFFDVIGENSKGVVAFPMDFFYPFPNNDRKKGKPYSYVVPHSYAIHHWEVSWINKQK